MKLKMFLIGLLSLALTACAGGCTTTGADGVKQNLTQAQKVEYVCATAITGLEAATAGARAGKVSYDQLKAVITIAETLSPICSAAVRPTVDDIKLQAMELAAARILVLARGSSGGSGGAP